MQRDPFATPMILFRIAWMTRYQGMVSGDTPVGGGAYVAEHGFGHEIFNFQPFQGAMKTYLDSYRICVVASALTQPRLEVFAYSNDSRRWESADGRVLNLQEVIGVRCIAM
jgi:hypothetical protein